jgi:1,4-dihydroxy-2-naphthoate octaprenyltransferase
MSSLRPWLEAGRPAQALLAPLGVAVGSSYAHFDARPGPGLSAQVVVIVAALGAGLGVNLVESGWDRIGAPPPEAGSSISDAEWPLASREAFLAGGAALAFATVCGLALVPLSGAAALGYGLLAVALGVLRRAPVFGLDTLGWGLGELATLLALGPLAALTGFAAQAGTGSSGAFVAGLPAGIIATAALFARHFTEREADDRLARVTPVVALGEDQARLVLPALPAVAVAAVVVATRTGEYGPWAVAAVAPLAFAALAGWRLPASADAAEYARWGRLALGCAVAALVCIVASLWIASPD